MAAKKSKASEAKAPTKAELDKMPPGVAVALAARYGIKYKRADANPAPAGPPTE